MTNGPVIVGIDFSDSALHAAHWTAANFETNAPLLLLHAVHVPAPPRFLRGMYPPLEPIIDDAVRGAEARLTELAAELERPAQTEVRVGRADEVLAAAAAEHDARLVVVGAHRERPGLWRVLGGTIDRMVRHVPCPVLLARGLPSGALRKALVAVDDSELSAPLLAWAADFAAGDPARIVVLHVVSGALAGAVRIGARGREARRAEESLREHAELWLRERVAETGLAGAARVVTLGDAAMEILRTARKRDADVIVIGAHGEGSGPFLGSTAEFVLRQGTGPVLVIRNGSSPSPYPEPRSA